MSIRTALLAGLLIVAGAMPAAAQAADQPAPGGTPIIVQKAPESSKRMTVSLRTVDERRRNQEYVQNSWGDSNGKNLKPPAEVAALLGGKTYFVYALQKLADGDAYYAAFRAADELKFITNNRQVLWDTKLIRLDKSGKAEVLLEGLADNGEIAAPVTVKSSPLGTDKASQFERKVGCTLSGMTNSQPSVNVLQISGPTLSGSELFEEGRLELKVALGGEFAYTPDAQVTVRFVPLQPGLPERTATGKATELLTLGAARFALVEVAPDLSSATLAVVAGSLEETLKQQLLVGQEMPTFAQMDLLARKTVTRSDILKRAASEKRPVLFVFGDIQTAGQPNYGYPANRTSYLPVPPEEITRVASADVSDKPLVYIVTKEISINEMYTGYANTDLPFNVLAEYVDATRTQFRVANNYGGGGWMGGDGGPPFASLRQLFNLPTGGIAVALFDTAGSVKYVKADAAQDFMQTLGEVNKLLQGAKQP